MAPKPIGETSMLPILRVPEAMLCKRKGGYTQNNLPWVIILYQRAHYEDDVYEVAERKMRREHRDVTFGKAPDLPTRDVPWHRCLSKPQFADEKDCVIT